MLLSLFAGLSSFTPQSDRQRGYFTSGQGAGVSEGTTSGGVEGVPVSGSSGRSKVSYDDVLLNEVIL